MAAKQNQSLRAFAVPSASVDICLYNKTYLCVYIWIVLAGRVHNLSFVVPNHSGRAGSKSQLRSAKSQRQGVPNKACNLQVCGLHP